jgi:hypothetical protein
MKTAAFITCQRINDRDRRGDGVDRTNARPSRSDRDDGATGAGMLYFAGGAAPGRDVPVDIDRHE